MGFWRKERSAPLRDGVGLGPAGLCQGRASMDWCTQREQKELYCQRLKCEKEVKEESEKVVGPDFEGALPSHVDSVLQGEELMQERSRELSL